MKLFIHLLQEIPAACIYHADIGMGIPKGVMHFIYIKTGPAFCVIAQIDGDRVKSDTQNTRKGQQLYRGDFTPLEIGGSQLANIAGERHRRGWPVGTRFMINAKIAFIKRKQIKAANRKKGAQPICCLQPVQIYQNRQASALQQMSGRPITCMGYLLSNNLTSICLHK